jgi:hypothetical protein
MKGALLGLLVVLLCPSIGNSQRCLIQPAHIRMDVPRIGFVWLENEEFEGPCDKVPDTAWVRYPSREFIMYIHADGPEGSGRFWNVTVGFSTNDQTKPQRGFCFVTSTVGWRTLRSFNQTPLQWMNDENGDGKPELVIWESFPLRDEPGMAGYGLVAWVYQVDREGKFNIDWNLSRRKASEIAAAYRKPLEKNDLLRERAAKALEDFASGKCTPDTLHTR